MLRFLLYIRSKMLAWWLEETSLKNITNITVYKYLTGSVQLKERMRIRFIGQVCLLIRGICFSDRNKFLV